MASERQIVANRRNARKSTGPRSFSGKQRAGQNSRRHGLSAPIALGTQFAEQLNRLAHKIAGDSRSEITHECARAIAQAELELARIRRAKVAIIQRVLVLGAVDVPKRFASIRDEIRFMKAILGNKMPDLPEFVDPVTTMPWQEPDRTAEAIRRALPELACLDRYERRAVSSRDRAVRTFLRLREEF